MQELHKLSAAEAVALVASGSLTIENLVEALLARIKVRGPVVQAWSFLNEELVLEEAKRLDALPKEKRGKLHGVVIGVKDVIYTRGMPTTYHSTLYDNDDAVGLDAGSIMSMRAEGALFLGKLYTTEFAATYAGGPSTNPHDVRRTPGGSSSGSGAAVGDYQVPTALGTQTVGSVIRPGSYNGIYSMKPTWGAITREGQRMSSVTLDTLGFFSRAVADLKLFLSALDVSDDEPAPSTPLDLKNATFAFVKTAEWQSAGPGTRAAMEKGANLLRRAGADVVDIDLPQDFDSMGHYHAVICSAEARTSFLGEYKLDAKALHPIIIEHVENKDGFTKTDLIAALDGAAALRPKLDAIAKQYTALITPSAMDVAPLGIENTGSGILCRMWTLLGNPVVQIPGFKGEDDMPIGLSLVSARYTDNRLLWVAQTVGNLFEGDGGWSSKL